MKEKLIEIKNLLKGHIITLIVIVVIIIGIPATLYLVKQQQDLRSRATGTEVGSLVFSPSSPRAVNKDSTFNLEFGINFASDQRITGVDVTITYPDKLQLDRFEKDTTVLSEEVMTSSNTFINPRTVRYAAVNKTGALPPRSFVSLGRLTFKAIDNGQAEIRIVDRQIVAKDQTGVLGIGDATVTYTIGGPSPSPSPSPSAPPVSVIGDVDKNGCLNDVAKGGSFVGDPVLIWGMIRNAVSRDQVAILYGDRTSNRPVDMRDYTTWWNIYRVDTAHHCP